MIAGKTPFREKNPLSTWGVARDIARQPPTVPRWGRCDRVESGWVGVSKVSIFVVADHVATDIVADCSANHVEPDRLADHVDPDRLADPVGPAPS